jgi:hypothetical protein
MSFLHGLTAPRYRRSKSLKKNSIRAKAEPVLQSISNTCAKHENKKQCEVSLVQHIGRRVTKNVVDIVDLGGTVYSKAVQALQEWTVHNHDARGGGKSAWVRNCANLRASMRDKGLKRNQYEPLVKMVCVPYWLKNVPANADKPSYGRLLAEMKARHAPHNPIVVGVNKAGRTFAATSYNEVVQWNIENEFSTLDGERSHKQEPMTVVADVFILTLPVKNMLVKDDDPNSVNGVRAFNSATDGHLFFPQTQSDYYLPSLNFARARRLTVAREIRRLLIVGKNKMVAQVVAASGQPTATVRTIVDTTFATLEEASMIDNIDQVRISKVIHPMCPAAPAVVPGLNAPPQAPAPLIVNLGGENVLVLTVFLKQTNERIPKPGSKDVIELLLSLGKLVPKVLVRERSLPPLAVVLDAEMFCGGDGFPWMSRTVDNWGMATSWGCATARRRYLQNTDLSDLRVYGTLLLTGLLISNWLYSLRDVLCEPRLHINCSRCTPFGLHVEPYC